MSAQTKGDPEKSSSLDSGEKQAAQYVEERRQKADGGFYAEDELFDPEAKDTLHRGLKSRQISMIALGGAVGTGLIIGSGSALQKGGPLGLLLGYAFVGFICYLVMVALGEMAAYLPHKKGFAGYATRFVDPALGFAVGWNYLMKYLIVTPNNINAAGVVLQYWQGGRDVHIAVWMTVFIVFIFIINLLGVRVFGELEFWFSSIKVLALIGLLLMGIIIDLGGNPQKDRIGFRYWEPPNGPMGTFKQDIVQNTSLATFLGFWSVMINALFAYIGTELIGVTVGEAENPRYNIPRAIRKTFWRITIFYVGGVFVIGLITPRTSDFLIDATKAKTGAAASPFVAAVQLVGITSLTHLINALILVFVLSAANSDLYIGSRTLYGLAVEGKAPRIFRLVDKRGVPWVSLILCTAFCGLVYLNVSSGAAKVFTYFVNLVSAFGALTWMAICWAHICFMRALKAQGRSRDDLPYKAPFNPWGSWFAMIATGIILIFKGYDTFMPFKSDTFITAYIALPVFVVLYLGYKLKYKTSFIPSDKVDLDSGLQQINEEEERYLAEQANKGPRTWYQRLWESL